MRTPNKQWTIDGITRTKESFICRRVHNYGTEVPHWVKQDSEIKGLYWEGRIPDVITKLWGAVSLSLATLVYAMEKCFDAYRLFIESDISIFLIGNFISGRKLSVLSRILDNRKSYFGYEFVFYVMQNAVKWLIFFLPHVKVNQCSYWTLVTKQNYRNQKAI